MLRVVPSSQATPERPLPASQKTTPWRFVDLKYCQKHVFPFHYHTDKLCFAKMISVLAPLEQGSIVNPEDW